MELQTFSLVIASLAIGVTLGVLLSSRLTFGGSRKNQEMEKHLHKAQDDLKNYQLEVTQHFSETAQLLKKMAESYRDVHNHLAQGANTLSKDGNGLPVMKKLPEIDTITSIGSDEPSRVAPPLDYAPKTTPYDRGTLDEDYHLEKVELSEKPIDIAEAIASHAKKP